MNREVVNPEVKEQLSAFMDGELGRDEARFLVRRAAGDAAVVARWARYHVARQVLRKQPVVAMRVDFAAAIMAEIDSEAVPRAGWNGWLKVASGGAIAAAVAVAALVVTKPSDAPAPIATMNPAAQPTPIRAGQPATTQLASTGAAERQPESLVPNSPIPSSVASFGTDMVQPASFDPATQSYVIRHYEATGATGQPDFVPYILLVPSTARTATPRPVENR